MSSLGWAMVIILGLTVIGSAALLLVTLKYYWGERGTPPLTRAERRKQKEAELAQRARQIEAARLRPVRPRNPSFWDNRKKG